LLVKYFVNLFFPPHRLKGQIPEIKQTLEILKYMQKKKVSVPLFAGISKSALFWQRPDFLDSLVIGISFVL
jgi:hypothetical protein